MSLREVASDPNIKEFTPVELYAVVLSVWGTTPYMPPKLEIFQKYPLEKQLATLDAIAWHNPGFWAESVLKKAVEITQTGSIDNIFGEKMHPIVANIPQARVRTPEGKVLLI